MFDLVFHWTRLSRWFVGWVLTAALGLCPLKAQSHCPSLPYPGLLLEWHATIASGRVEEWFELLVPDPTVGSSCGWLSIMYDEDSRMLWTRSVVKARWYHDAVVGWIEHTGDDRPAPIRHLVWHTDSGEVPIALTLIDAHVILPRHDWECHPGAKTCRGLPTPAE